MTHIRTSGLVFLAFKKLVQGATADMTEVSVCQDATFQIPTSRGAVCSGSGAQPLGVQCPRMGDTALDECHSYLDSFNGVNCIAREDAQCVHLDGRNAWGCTFPSTWCSDKWKAPEETASDDCPTWNFYSDESSAVDPFDVGSQGDRDPAWFTKTTKVTTLYNCKADTPTPAPIQDTAIPTTPSEIPVYTMAPTPTATMVPQIETVVTAILEVPVSETPGTPVQTEPASLVPILKSTSPLDASYPDPTPIDMLVTISPTPTIEEHPPAPSEAPTSLPEILTGAPCTNEVRTIAPTYETLPPSTSIPEQTWTTPTETPAATTSTPVPTIAPILGSKPWYPTPTATMKELIVPEATEPTSTTATETLVATSPPLAATTLPPYDVEPEPQTPEPTPYYYYDDTPCPSETQTSTPIFTTPPAPLENMETDVPSTPPATLDQTPVSTDEIRSSVPPTTEPLATKPPSVDEPTTEVPIVETPTSEAPTIDSLATETTITEMPTTVAPLATIQTSYQQEEQQNYQQLVDTTAPPATTQAITEAPTVASVYTTPLPAQPSDTPCPSQTSNRQTSLQASTESDLTTIAAVSISAAAVIAIIIAIGTILVVTIAIFRAQSRSNQPQPPPDSEGPFNHSIVPSDF
ncbi:hypothetical protein GN958_ATG11732 [Phytophthora infestans]|uniref:Carbohydrate-binding protein n=1 Tax=Phytophthora infestans TaxID=4787 RepID=A0A8S9UEK1_PHYIN|nr:hypothetical protein GN958_ATG11732 [Phytophthora infestans]